LLTRGQEVDAHQAKAIGLINEVYPEETFSEAVDAFARRYERTGKSAVSLTKSLLYQIDGLSFREAIETGVDVNVVARMTEDCQKGIARFLKKQ
jgi:methylglutaconyl-CoA hydratase